MSCKAPGDDERRDSGEMERLIAVLKSKKVLQVSDQWSTVGLTGHFLTDSTNLACNGSAQTPEQAVLCSPKLPAGLKLEPAATATQVPQQVGDEDDKENVSKTPTKPKEIAPSISNIEKCSAIQMATAVLRIESASGESTTIATSMTTITNVDTPESGGAVKQSGSGKSNPLMRIRTNSNASGSEKPSKLVKQSSTPGSSSSSSLMKKTIAKVTAAFKTSSSKPVDHNSLRSRLTSKKPTTGAAAAAAGYTRHHEGGPMRVEYEKPRNLSPTNQSSATNRRCSSVPRTLREKQALVRSGAIVEAEHVAPPTATTTLGEKIQNFFSSSSSHSNNLNTAAGSANAAAASKNARQNSIKAKENPVKGESGGQLAIGLSTRTFL